MNEYLAPGWRRVTPWPRTDCVRRDVAAPLLAALLVALVSVWGLWRAGWRVYVVRWR